MTGRQRRGARSGQGRRAVARRTVGGQRWQPARAAMPVTVASRAMAARCVAVAAGLTTLSSHPPSPSLAQAALARRLRESELNLAARMAREEEREGVALREEAAHAEAARAYRASQGRAVTEARVDEYMRARTKGGVELLDPTGREFKLQPSQVTVVKDRGFGLGRAATQRPDVVAAVQAKVSRDLRGATMSAARPTASASSDRATSATAQA